jgi:hypothetical protein
MILIADTAPLSLSDPIEDGDVFACPSLDRIFRVGEVGDDDVFGGEICEADYPDYSLEWVWLPRAALVEQGFRRLVPATAVH